MDDNSNLDSQRLAESGRQWEEGGVWFYVGESEAIRTRLAQHRSRWAVSSTAAGNIAGRGGVAGKGKLDAIVLPVENKSSARRFEASLIRAMKEEGFHLISDKDGSRVNLSP